MGVPVMPSSLADVRAPSTLDTVSVCAALPKYLQLSTDSAVTCLWSGLFWGNTMQNMQPV